MASKSDFKRLIKDAEKAGWTVEPSRGGHLKWKAPTGAVVFSASTPSDHRAIKNHLSLLRKAGLNLG